MKIRRVYQMFQLTQSLHEAVIENRVGRLPCTTEGKIARYGRSD
jgi:hypothetical protein